MFDLVNQDRQLIGVQELAWDGLAAAAGSQHAQEMAGFGYLSHWNLDGYGPDYRYHLQGGINAVQENVYLRSHGPGGQPTSSEMWLQLIAQAHQALLDSPGHRNNILAAEHTHLGIGIAYNSATGILAIAQEFANNYVTLQALPLKAALGGEITFAGRVLSGAGNPVLNLAYEPFPETLTVAELLATSTYASPAETYASLPMTVGSGGDFSVSVTLNNADQPGLYHMYLFVETSDGPILAVDTIIEVR